MYKLHLPRHAYIWNVHTLIQPSESQILLGVICVFDSFIFIYDYDLKSSTSMKTARPFPELKNVYCAAWHSSKTINHEKRKPKVEFLRLIVLQKSHKALNQCVQVFPGAHKCDQYSKKGWLCMLWILLLAFLFCFCNCFLSALWKHSTKSMNFCHVTAGCSWVFTVVKKSAIFIVFCWIWLEPTICFCQIFK